MNLDLGHDLWRLRIRTNRSGEEQLIEEAIIEVGEVLMPDRTGLEDLISLTARQLENSLFAGRLGVRGLKLRNTGFDANGIALKEDGSTFLIGQTWQADRVHHA